MDSDRERKIIDFLFLGEFSQVQLLIADLDENALTDLFLRIASDTGSIAVYSFLCSLLLQQEQVFLHDIACTLLAQPLCHYEGAYGAALYHAQRALVLEPTTLRKITVLSFYTLPDSLLSSTQALRLAQEILKEDPNNYLAKTILSELV